MATMSFVGRKATLKGGRLHLTFVHGGFHTVRDDAKEQGRVPIQPEPVARNDPGGYTYVKEV
jgi:hypothetical protein